MERETQRTLRLSPSQAQIVSLSPLRPASTMMESLRGKSPRPIVPDPSRWLWTKRMVPKGLSRPIQPSLLHLPQPSLYANISAPRRKISDSPPPLAPFWPARRRCSRVVWRGWRPARSAYTLLSSLRGRTREEEEMDERCQPVLLGVVDCLQRGSRRHHDEAHLTGRALSDVREGLLRRLVADLASRRPLRGRLALCALRRGARLRGHPYEPDALQGHRILQDALAQPAWARHAARGRPAGVLLGAPVEYGVPR